MDEITVTLTREQWERVWRMIDDAPVTGWYPECCRELQRAICEQAGLGEEFRCE